MVAEAIEKGFSHLMMIDADLQFPVDGINKLIAKNADIAFGTYNRKNRDYKERLQYPAGFMLIDLEAVSMMEHPLFRCDFPVGEDSYFFAKARACGLEIVRDDSIETTHIGKGDY